MGGLDHKKRNQVQEPDSPKDNVAAKFSVYMTAWLSVEIVLNVFCHCASDGRAKWKTANRAFKMPPAINNALLMLASDFKSGQFCDKMLACSGTFCRFRQFPMVPARYNTPIPSETADQTRA